MLKFQHITGWKLFWWVKCTFFSTYISALEMLNFNHMKCWNFSTLYDENYFDECWKSTEKVLKRPFFSTFISALQWLNIYHIKCWNFSTLQDENYFDGWSVHFSAPTFQHLKCLIFIICSDEISALYMTKFLHITWQKFSTSSDEKLLCSKKKLQHLVWKSAEYVLNTTFECWKSTEKVLKRPFFTTINAEF